MFFIFLKRPLWKFYKMRENRSKNQSRKKQRGMPESEMPFSKKRTSKNRKQAFSTEKPPKSKPAYKKASKKGFGPDEKIRLNRFMANAGVCSRREADQFINSGCVTVNGKIVSELGTKVTLSDDVRFNGEQLNPESKVYLLLNKPKGFVTTTNDPQERKTVMQLVEKACRERIYPVGRLDKDTTGLLLFTNDGDMAKKLTHPGHNVKKIYHVILDKPPTKNHLLEIAGGSELEDGTANVDAISYIADNEKTEVGVEIHSGKNRIVRRIFEHFGYSIKKLDRVFFAGLTKKNIPRGKWRFLTKTEINQLKMK